MAEAETEDAPEPGEGPEPEEPELDKSEVYSEILEGTDYAAEALEPAYSEISEDDYILDEDEEYVIFETSAWQEIDEALESETSEEPDSFWDSAKSYLFDHDDKYAAGGITGIATGFLAESLGYMTAASALVTGGGAALGWGIGGYIGKRISDYWSDSEEVKDEPTHELAEFPSYEVKFLKEDAALDAT